MSTERQTSGPDLARERRRPSRASWAAAALTLALAQAARAEDPPAANASKTVDFSKPPSKVEAFDKTRVAVKGSKDARTGALSLDVSGAAYYPDGTVYLVTARHAKLQDAFAETKAVVKDHAFSVRLGPFDKTIPGGELVVDAWFSLGTQPDEVKTALEQGSYFHCSPPCRYDRRNVTIARYGLGGAEAQARDEKAEKDELARSRTALLDARAAATASLRKIRAGEQSADPAGLVAKRLEEDAKETLETLARWRSRRLFLLFPGAWTEVEALAKLVREDGARLAGSKPESSSSDEDSTADELKRVSDALKTFLDESGSLDKACEARRARKKDEARPRPAEHGDGNGADAPAGK